MCGIAGIFDTKKNPSIDELLPMVKILEHRGPDHQGTFVNGPLAFGMRRLSIIDLTTGDQPIFNMDKSVIVILNGEIYNYVELRESLMKRGYKFATHTDTEVLVHLYAEYGIEMLDMLNGMFAFSIWDEKKQTVFIVRDRIGIKPLYYTQAGAKTLFASEIKSLLTHEVVDQKLSQNSLSDYLRLGYIPRGATPYESIYKLLPGHYIELSSQGLKNVQWWDGKSCYTAQEEATDDYDLITEQHFDSSIRLRMRSDVPVAAFLSGGLDSSLISVTASRLSPIKLQTYNVKFDDALFDESAFANKVADHGKTDHQQLIANPADILDKLPLLLWHMDEPISDSAMIPNFMVSEFASQQVKVCLSGLGGDELFGGYSRYLDRAVGPYRRYLSGMPWLVSLILPFLKLFKSRYVRNLEPLTGKGNEWRSYLNQIELFHSDELKKMGLKEIGDTEKIIKDLWEEYPGKDPVGRRQYIDQHTYLPDQILALTDRMSMAVSLEVRVPFLDHHLVKQAAQLPAEKKQTSNGDFKIWLKENLGNRVPVEILNRKKWGFDAPVKNWIYSPLLEDIIPKLPDALEDILDRNQIAKQILNHDDPRHHNMVWSFLVLAVWLKVHNMKKAPTQSLMDLFE